MKKSVENKASESATKSAPVINVDSLPIVSVMAKSDEFEIGDEETPEITKIRKVIQSAANGIAKQSEAMHNAIVEAVEELGVSREVIIQWVEDCGYSNSRARELVSRVWIDARGQATSGKKKGSTKNKDKVQALMTYARNLCADDDEASKTLRAAQRQIDAARTAAKVELKKAA